MADMRLLQKIKSKWPLKFLSLEITKPLVQHPETYEIIKFLEVKELTIDLKCDEDNNYEDSYDEEEP